jgi:hypothetical protein
MTINSKYLIVAVIAIFAAALISGPIITFAVPNRSNSGLALCQPTGKTNSSTGAQLVQCCWHESVPKGTGYAGGDKEMYCSECDNGGTRGYINCSNPELQYKEKPITSESGGFPKGGVLQQPDNPNRGDDISNPDNDGEILDQTETSSNIGNTGNVPQNGEALRE